jgi:hypothetical protein
MICATILLGMGTCGACCHKRGKSYVTDKEAKLRDRALGRAKELVHMGAHGADKLLKDIQTYHDMHHKIITQKMHQITPRRNGGRYGEKPCESPQCSECPKPRHMSVGYSSSSQKATVQRASSSRQTDSNRPTNASAAAADRPTATDRLPAFISPSKWDPIKNGKLAAVPQDKVNNNMIPGRLTNLLERQGEQNERRMHKILSNSANRQKLHRPYVSVPMGLPSSSAD